MGFFSRALDNLPKVCADIGVTEERLREDAAVVKEWLRLQPHLPNDGLECLLVENMLLRNKGSTELTKQALERFFAIRGTNPDIYVDNDPCSKEEKRIQEKRFIAVLPDLTSAGHRVVVTNVPSPDSKFEQSYVITTLKQIFMTSDILIDENSYKFRVKGIHLYQAPSTIGKFLQLAKTILPQKIAGRIHLHPDYASLSHHFDMKVLPKDFGGDQKSLLELAATWRQEEISHRQWLIDIEKMWRTDEKKRPPDSLMSWKEDDAFGIDGSFKKLEFD